MLCAVCDAAGRVAGHSDSGGAAMRCLGLMILEVLLLCGVCDAAGCALGA